MLTEKRMRPLCKEYENGATVKEICKREGIKEATFRWWLRKLKCNIRGRRVQTLDEKYFSSIDTQDKAYILGFLMADGCVCKTGPTAKRPNRLFINISHKDRKILEYIKKELKCSYEIVDYMPSEATYGNNMMSKLAINSTPLCNDLAKYGIVARKTGIEKLPDLPSNMLPHFIRGFFDGDGTAYYCHKKYKDTTYRRLNIGFCSNYEMLSSIEDIFKSIGVKKYPKICAEKRTTGEFKNLYDISYGAKQDVKLIQHYMYDNANFFLKRKKLS